jgi:hypothetical protein
MLLLRTADRQFWASLFQLPPRITRLEPRMPLAFERGQFYNPPVPLLSWATEGKSANFGETSSEPASTVSFRHAFSRNPVKLSLSTNRPNWDLFSQSIAASTFASSLSTASPG